MKIGTLLLISWYLIIIDNIVLRQFSVFQLSTCSHFEVGLQNKNVFSPLNQSLTVFPKTYISPRFHLMSIMTILSKNHYLNYLN